MKKKLAALAEKFKKMKLGKIEVVDLKKEFNFSDDFDYFDIAKANENGFSKKRKISAYAFYSNTSGCSDSCGSSTNCC